MFDKKGDGSSVIQTRKTMKPRSFILRIFESKKEKRARIVQELDEIRHRINLIEKGVSAESLAKLEKRRDSLTKSFFKLGTPTTGS